MGGKRYNNFIFTNISAETCTLEGFPTFILLNKAGKPLKGAAVKVTNDHEFISGDMEEAGETPSAVTLEPDQTAWFQVYTNDGMALEKPRKILSSAKVKVTAPNDKIEIILESEISPCCGVSISYVRRGLPQ